ncbi:MAG TPA: DUF2783 domain-containing protein [Alphaproteobacteria bacterium]
MASALSVEDLESVWEQLAVAIDRAGPTRDRLFLAKLAVLLANALGDRTAVERLIDAALADLE